MADKFQRHDSITHLKSGHVYMVLAGPCDGVTIEATCEPAYVYQRFWTVEDARLWVRPAREMEDGRFAFKHRSTHGAGGRFPDA